MTQFWISVAEWALTGVLAVIAGVLARTVRGLKAQFAALKRGQQMQLRAELIELHRVWIVDRGYMPVETKRLFHDMFCAYEALGENGVIRALYDDVREAHVAPDNTDDIIKEGK